jgi:hypothetical protein
MFDRFHRPIEGEEGYEPFDPEKAKIDLSSLAQIVSISIGVTYEPTNVL